MFLPAAGNRNGTNVNDVGNNGNYWSSTAYDKNRAWALSFYEDDVNPGCLRDRSCGQSVRLVGE